MSERETSVEQVREQHLGDVSQPAHWLYLVAVLGLGSVLMIILISVLDVLS